MSHALSTSIIREINPSSQSEIELVAFRMRDTLIEVLGAEKGTALYTMDWLIHRVLWHLDPLKTNAKIFLSENAQGAILAHAIARIEPDEGNNSNVGYFSTLYVAPEFRNQGVATNLILHVEKWFREMQMPKIIYNTAENHFKLIGLFSKFGYQITTRHEQMVQLSKELSVEPMKTR